MLSLLVLTVVSVLPYDKAFEEHTTNDKPMLVLVGADWCPACVEMKTGPLARLDRAGKLKKVAFSAINTDHDQKTARKIMRGGTIPQLILFGKKDGKIFRRQLTGSQSDAAIEQFIKE